MYGVDTTNLAWFASYLNGRKQYIKITESADTAKKDIKYGVPRDSILGLLLSLLYVNNLPNSSNVLVPIIFTDYIPSHLPTLKINNHDIKRVNTIKFIGVLLDDNLSWKEHIKYLENKIAQNIGLMYRAKPFLDKEFLLTLYYSNIH